MSSAPHPTTEAGAPDLVSDAHRRLAAGLLLAGGALFLAVVGYLFGVLFPAGLTFDLLDDPAGMLTWLTGHAGPYAGLYYLYLAQQVVLLAAVVAVHRVWRRDPGADGFGRDLAAVAGTVAVVLAVASIALLVMAAHGGATAWSAAADDGQRFTVMTTYEAGADLGKGLRVLSEPFLGAWLVWLGLAARRSGGGRGWLLLLPVGAWTAVVGLWKFVDPLMPFEDWLPFVVSLALVGAGAGLLPSRRR